MTRPMAVGVVAHVARLDMAERLAEEVGAACISMDTGELGPSRNHIRTWQELAVQQSEWSVVFEDDAVPVVRKAPDFRRLLGAALQHSPRPVISVYLGSGWPPQHQDRIADAVAKAQANDASYILASENFHGVATAVRTELVPEMLAHVAQRRYLPVDQAIGSWARRKWRNIEKHPIAYTAPSLVDHRDGSTLVKHPDGGVRTVPRRAHHVGMRTVWDSRNVVVL